MNIKEFEKLKTLVMNMEKDVIKFEQGNNAAGGRMRKSLQEMKTNALVWRKGIQEIRNKRIGK